MHAAVRYTAPRSRIPKLWLSTKPLTGGGRPVRSTHTRPEVSNLQGPLDGVKILDLTRVLAGPFCTQILADYGADVIKVEQPKTGDDTRLWCEKSERGIWKSEEKNMSVYFNTINRNKRSITVNLKDPKGKEIILGLARRADVIVENFVPGKLDELGLGYEALRRVNRSIILASISGYGATGPYSKRAGYDVVAAAEAGLLHITGEADGPPTKPGVGLMDMCTGLYLHGAIASALFARERTGMGQKIDTSLFEATVSILANVGMSWLNDAFRTRDSFIVVGAVNDRQFQILCRILGDEHLASDERFVNNESRVENRQDLKLILARLFEARTTDRWLEAFEGSGLPYGPINTLQQVFSHPQVAAREMVQTVDQQAAVRGQINVLGIPVKFSKTKPSIRQGPPKLGQHTENVLKEMGLSDDELSKLKIEGAI